MNIARFVLIALVVAPGCGSSDEVTLDKLPSAMAGAVCKQSFACCTTADVADNTMSTCQTNTGLGLSLLASIISSSQAKGRARYHPAEAGACIDALSVMSCADWKDPRRRGELSPACGRLVTPLTDDGQPCGNDIDCKSGFCDGDVLGSDISPAKDGVCKPLAPAGGACQDDEGCAAGTFCDDDTRQCTAARPDGSPCNGDRACSAGYCTEQGQCTSEIPVGKCYGGCTVGGRFGGNGALAGLFLALGILVARWRGRRRPTAGGIKAGG